MFPYIDLSEWGVTVTPSTGPVLGGFEVSVSGPCLNPATDTVSCTFGDTTVTGMGFLCNQNYLLLLSQPPDEWSFTESELLEHF